MVYGALPPGVRSQQANLFNQQQHQQQLYEQQQEQQQQWQRHGQQQQQQQGHERLQREPNGWQQSQNSNWEEGLGFEEAQAPEDEEFESLVGEEKIGSRLEEKDAG